MTISAKFVPRSHNVLCVCLNICVSICVLRFQLLKYLIEFHENWYNPCDTEQKAKVQNYNFLQRAIFMAHVFT
jgi:hypothetical protein